jgi:predicted dehydrogenase
VRDTEAVQLVIVGLNFGKGMANLIQRDVPSLRVAGLCDQDTAKAMELGTKLGATVYDSLDAALEDPAVEAIGLFTGPHGRAALISKILRAGKHIITTKPFELDLDAAARVLDEARERKLAIHLNSPAPHPSEDLQVIAGWVKEHQLGLPLSLHAQTWAHYREQANGTWYDDPRLCPAAPILRLGIYFLNDFVPLLGPARRVFASQSRIFTKRPTADHAQVALEFKGGGVGTVFASFCTNDGQPYRDQVLLHYENGTIRRWMERVKGPDMGRDYAVLELTTGGKQYEARTTPGAYAGWYQWDAFARAVRSNEPTSLEHKERILTGLRLMDSVRRSLETGLPEEVS